MGEMRRLYDLNGLVLAVIADEQDVGFLDPILAPLALAAEADPDWTISVSVAGAIAAPASSDVIWQGPLPEGLESILSRSDGRPTLTVVDQFSMTHRAESHSTSIQVATPGTKAMGGTAAFWLIDEILTERNQFLLHAACLVRPESDEAIALFAPSGTGKTTTALALAGNGLALATDDAVVLQNGATRTAHMGHSARYQGSSANSRIDALAAAHPETMAGRGAGASSR